MNSQNLRNVLMVSSFGLLLFFVAILPTMYVTHNASGQSVEAVEENKIKLARQVIEAFNTGDVSNVSQFISPDYINHESRSFAVIENSSNIPDQFRDIIKHRTSLKGPEEFIDTIKNLRHAFPDIRHKEQATIAQGDMVVSIINVTGTNTGNFFILPPTGNKVNYEEVHIYRIGEDGKIIEHKAIRDDLTFLAQLGVVGPLSPEYQPVFQALTGVTNSSRLLGSIVIVNPAVIVFWTELCILNAILAIS
jgi:nogalonic acid methyl ester cyclase / aklanonic acid methyl ester cyclase